MKSAKGKRKTKPAARTRARPDPRVSGRASRIYRLLMDKATRERAISAIRSALRAAKGRVDIAATDLQVSSRTLSRWLSIAGLREYASSQRQENSIPGPRL